MPAPQTVPNSHVDLREGAICCGMASRAGNHECMCILVSPFGKERDRVALTFSTRKAEMPLGPGPPVRAITRYTSEAPPPLMKALLPCIMQHMCGYLAYRFLSHTYAHLDMLPATIYHISELVSQMAGVMDAHPAEHSIS